MMMNHFLRSNHFMKLHSLLAMLVLFLSLVGCNPKEEDNNFSITSLSETFGSPNGGTEITINGNNFSLVDGITFDGLPCTDVTIVSITQITCTIPAHGAGLVTVKIFGRANRVATATYTYGVIPLTITSFLPSSGNEAGLINIDIVGAGFLAGATVTIGGVNCPSVVVNSSSLLSCTVPAHAAGSATIVVTNPDLITTASSPTDYEYQVAPVLTSVSPTFAMLAGGGVLTITGTGFVAGNTVKVGGTVCPVLTEALTSITCTIPPKTAWTYSVAVTNDNLLVGTLQSAFTYRGPPTITLAGPNNSPLAGGVLISIVGTGFYAGSTATIGGVDCPVSGTVTNTLLTCTNPANAVAGAYAVAVTNADTQTISMAGGFNYYAAPAVTSFSPTAGPVAGGGTLTLTGTGFRAGAGIKIGTSPCASVSVSSLTSATCVLPPKTAASYTVTLTNTDFQAGTSVPTYTYQPPPTVTSVALNAGALGGGTAVTVTGTGFTAGATVDFGGSNCGAPLTVVSATSITCTTTAHDAGAVTATVTNADSQSGFVANAFTYQAAPTVTSVALNGGALGGATAVTVTGTGFLAGATVDFGGSNCGTPLTVVSATSITCTTTAHAAGAVTATVTNADLQSGFVASAFTYRAAPTVTSVAFNAGALGGGRAVTVTGTGFLAGATVDFGGSSCGAPFTVVSATSITCTTTAHAVGAVTATVTNADLQSGFVANAFTYQAAPTVTLVTASSGLQVGGLAVTISGTGFLALPTLPTVTFDGTACTGIAVVSATSITCTTPALAGGTPVDLAVDVVVCNADSQCGTGVGVFTYTATPVLAFSPSIPLYDFGGQNNDVMVTLTITNTGDGTSGGLYFDVINGIPVSSIYTLTPISLLAIDGCSGVALAAGASCTFDLAMEAWSYSQVSQFGTYTATLDVIDSIAAPISLSLTGDVIP